MWEVFGRTKQREMFVKKCGGAFEDGEGEDEDRCDR
jgi:hypothetical protein